MSPEIKIIETKRVTGCRAHGTWEYYFLTSHGVFSAVARDAAEAKRIAEFDPASWGTFERRARR